MRELVLHQIDRFEAREVQGISRKMLEFVFIERLASGQEIETIVASTFKDDRDNLIEDLVEGIGNIISIHCDRAVMARDPNMIVLAGRCREPT